MRLFFLLLINFIFFSSLFADKIVSNNGNNVDIEFILKKVQLNNPNLKMKELETDIQKKEVLKSWKNVFLPPVSISEEQDVDTIDDEGVEFNQVEASIPLFEGGKSYYNYKKSQVEYDIAKKNEVLTLLDYQEQAIEQYFSILNYRKQKEITNLVLEALSNQSSRLQNLYQSDQQIALSEVYKIEADIEMNKSINIANRHFEESSTEKLYKILGMDLNSKNNFIEFSIDRYLKEKINFEDDERKLLRESTVSKIEELKIDSANYDLKLAKSELYPTVNANSRYTFFKTNSDDEEGWEAELGFKWLFSWGATLDNISQKEQNLIKAKLEYENQMKDLTVRFREQYRTIGSLYGQLLAQKKRVDLLEKNLTLDTLRYDNQLITTFDFLNSVNELKKSQEEYYKLQRNLVLTTIKYENLIR